RLEEIIAAHEEVGAMVFNPHRYTLEEGGRQTVDATQLAFKKEADPKGLLNPGKMIAWDDPDWDFAKMYDYPGMMAAE
ncbi:MAG: FAD-binding protein, partial [Pseudomonadota bacterium]